MAEVYDRWYKRDPETGKKVRSVDYGCKSRWQVRWRDDSPRHNQRKRNFTKRVDADAYRAEVESSLNRGTYVDPTAGRITLKEYGQQWLEAQTFDALSREHAETHLRKHIYPAFGDRQLRTLQQPSLIQAWLGGLNKRYAPNHVRSIFSTLSAILSAAVDDNRIVKNPCRADSVKLPAVPNKRIIPWSAETVTMVRDALPRRYQAMVLVGAGCGLRQGEILGLAVDAIDWLRGLVHVRLQVRLVRNRLVFAPPKHGKSRDVPLPESVALQLAAHLKAYPAQEVTLPSREPDGEPFTARLIFTSKNGAINRKYLASDAWKPALKAAGIAPTRENGMHALRHHYASLLLEQGVSVKALAEYLGHADPGFTLRIYTHLMPASSDKARTAVDLAYGAPSALSVPSVAEQGR